jgi:hypothetical protein
MTQYNPFGVVNVELATIYAKSRRLRRLPDEIVFLDPREGDLTPEAQPAWSLKKLRF